MRRGGRSRALGFCWLLYFSGACVTSIEGPVALETVEVATQTQTASFTLPRLDGGIVDASELRGRLALVVVAATYDTASQAAISIAASVVRRHKPRINGLFVALEPDSNRPLIQAFVSALDLPFPVAIADADALVDVPAFGGIRHVPSFILLDQDGRVVWRRVGLANSEVLEAALLEHRRP